jgi:enhancer of polycomb-like protein
MEFSYPLKIAKQLLNWETLKTEATQQAQVVWEKRLSFADFKLKFPSLHDKIDEELLVDKERPVKQIESA